MQRPSEYSVDEVPNRIRNPPTLNAWSYTAQPNRIHAININVRQQHVEHPKKEMPKTKSSEDHSKSVKHFNKKVYPENAKQVDKKYYPILTIVTILIYAAGVGWTVYENGGLESIENNPYYGPSKSVSIIWRIVF